MQAQFELSQPPADGISSVNFANGNDTLLATSWDGSARLYDVNRNAMLIKFDQKKPMLDGAFSLDDTKGFAGGLDGKLYMMDFKGGKESQLGSHSKTIKCVEYCESTGQIISGGWDAQLKLWDPRAQDPLAGSCELKGSIYSMSVSASRVVVATKGRHVQIYDIRKMSEPEQDRLSSLQHQLRVVSCFPDGTGYAVGSCEGRIAIEYFDPSEEIQKKKYAFKCHRKNNNGVQTLYPVNALAFHPKYGTFASGGCDGMVSVWDGFAKKRVYKYPAFETSISSLAYNRTGTMLAIAQSYTFEQGEIEHPRDTIFIRNVSDAECKNKPRKI